MEGNGRTISGLTIDTLSSAGSGLFGVIGAAATVRNITFEDVSISANTAGAVAGISSGTITGITVASGTVGRANADYVGGVVGRQNNAARISGNTNNADIVGANRVGGIAGNVQLVAQGQAVDNVENSGTVSGVGYVGGIFGRINGVNVAGVGNGGGSVTMATNSGTVTGTGDNVGGIAGFAQGALVSVGWNIVFSGNVNSADIEGHNHVGGILGNGNQHVASIADSQNTGDITGNNWVGGFAGRAVGTMFSGLTNENVIIGNAYVGGIAGQAGQINNSINRGDLTANGVIVEAGATNVFFGGLAGLATGINNSRNYSNIIYTGAGANVGGLVGAVNGAVVNSQNEGDVSSGGSRVGGIAGNVQLVAQNQAIDNITNSGNVVGVSYVGGIFGRINGVNVAGVGSGGGSVTMATNGGIVTGTGNHVGGIAGFAQGALASVGWNIVFSGNTVLGGQAIVGTVGQHVSVVV